MLFAATLTMSAQAQQGITAEQLIELNRVGGMGVNAETSELIYAVSKVDIASNKKSTEVFGLNLKEGTKRTIEDPSKILGDPTISADGKYQIVVKEVKLDKVFGTDYYPELKQSNVQIYNDLDYRHWDTWQDGKFNHLFVKNLETGEMVDIMEGEKFECPTQPFGGAEDYTWNAEGTKIYYVCKKLYGKEYAVSTNTDIYVYDLATGKTSNLTEGNMGYDTNPVFSAEGKLAYLQMKRDGYESDKNDIIYFDGTTKHNLTAAWDGTVNSFVWSEDEKSIYFVAPTGGEAHLFKIDLPGKKKILNRPVQITNGQFDVRGIVGWNKKNLLVMRGDMNHASEVYSVDVKSGEMAQVTDENDDLYASIGLSKIDKRIVKTTDGKDMVTWVVYPPDFDSTKQYPTLLYCQGGPQGALSQFYSYRWNFQLMAAQGYIVVAPNRRGMPGHGVEWNEQISKDYGGQNMKDYLAAIDDVAKESYVDKNRLGCIGASYGGYSVFYLAAIHEGRFKSFIAHDGIFNWQSMYGTTEEMFFVNWDLGGAYWDKDNAVAQKAYNEFNPADHVEKWDSPIMIIQGGLDFRVPIGQGLEAYQAAQLQGLKSRLLYFPEENHWVLDYQNSLIWHTEFQKWLKETL
ncbi:Dipeptidyl aminopeptidase/acylaminoacyl peptidase [Lishizhenia tianjinensis]|uniref:Dipeptidyl aminopeptidase/acylaminoacyl peptidase n=2 Tax=Lishizhenia tianjinensis TaxID=477690 RepID=A0A1I7B9W7_9FLAO|nr:Dipeptidyl aminopeptidase/acylaminoacyl peptidase [Lishizhenia tianjinensis]